MFRPLQFKVSCTHEHVPAYNLTDALVQVYRYADLPDAAPLYYASGVLGCSKNYATPEEAILGMFSRASCTNIRIAAVR